MQLFFFFLTAVNCIFLLFPAMQQYNLVACLLLLYVTFWFLLSVFKLNIFYRSEKTGIRDYRLSKQIFCIKL